MSIELFVLIVVATIAFIVFFVNWLRPYKTVNPDDMSEYGKMLIKAIQDAGEKGVICERNYEYNNGAMPPIFYRGHCFSRAIGVEFNPKSGWWIIYADQGGSYKLTKDHLYQGIPKDKIIICNDLNRGPSLFNVHKIIKE